MSDRYGKLSLPAPVPAGGAAVTDPALDVLLGYLRAVLNARMNDAWHSVSPQTNLIETVRAEDPERCNFNTEWLPALFLWRGDRSNPNRIADDWRVIDSQLRLLWVFEPAPREWQEIREPILGGFEKALDDAIECERHPAWIVPGDSDRNAWFRGSNILRHAGLMHAHLAFTQRADLRIPMDDGGMLRPFEGILAGISIRELLVRDPDADPGIAPAALNLDLTQQGAVLGHLDEAGGFSSGFDFGFENYDLRTPYDSGFDTGFS